MTGWQSGPFSTSTFEKQERPTSAGSFILTCNQMDYCIVDTPVLHGSAMRKMLVAQIEETGEGGDDDK